MKKITYYGTTYVCIHLRNNDKRASPSTNVSVSNEACLFTLQIRIVCKVYGLWTETIRSAKVYGPRKLKLHGPLAENIHINYVLSKSIPYYYRKLCDIGLDVFVGQMHRIHDNFEIVFFHSLIEFDMKIYQVR